MPEKPNERDAKLAQWLNEAHAKEAELEVALTAHIGLTEKRAYKDRLRRHLTETRDHKRRVAARIKKLGGSPVAGPNLPGVPDAVGEVAGKAVAAAKTQSEPPARSSTTRSSGSCETLRRSSGRSTSRSPCTRGSSRSPKRSVTARPRSWPRRSAATRSGWRSTSTPSSCGWSRKSFASRSRATSAPRGARAGARRARRPVRAGRSPPVGRTATPRRRSPTRRTSPGSSRTTGARPVAQPPPARAVAATAPALAADTQSPPRHQAPPGEVSPVCPPGGLDVHVSARDNPSGTADARRNR